MQKTYFAGDDNRARDSNHPWTLAPKDPVTLGPSDPWTLRPLVAFVGRAVGGAYSQEGSGRVEFQLFIVAPLDRGK